jgi:hypothetical protein
MAGEQSGIEVVSAARRIGDDERDGLAFIEVVRDRWAARPQDQSEPEQHGLCSATHDAFHLNRRLAPHRRERKRVGTELATVSAEKLKHSSSPAARAMDTRPREEAKAAFWAEYEGWKGPETDPAG